MHSMTQQYQDQLIEFKGNKTVYSYNLNAHFISHTFQHSVVVVVVLIINIL